MPVTRQVSRSQRRDPELWEAVKSLIMLSQPGPWSARKSQLAVLEYRKLGGTYTGPKKPSNALAKWTKEEWGYVDGDKSGRYLPKQVRKTLTPSEKRSTNRRKKDGAKKGKARVAYSKTVNSKMKTAGVY
jgi:hypothetical protein